MPVFKKSYYLFLHYFFGPSSFAFSLAMLISLSVNMYFINFLFVCVCRSWIQRITLQSRVSCTPSAAIRRCRLPVVSQTFFHRWRSSISMTIATSSLKTIPAWRPKAARVGEFRKAGPKSERTNPQNHRTKTEKEATFPPSSRKLLYRETIQWKNQLCFFFLFFFHSIWVPRLLFVSPSPYIHFRFLLLKYNN